MSRLHNTLLNMVMTDSYREKQISTSTTSSSPGLYSYPDESFTVSLHSSDSRASGTTSGRKEEVWQNMAGIGGGAHNNDIMLPWWRKQLRSEMPTCD